MSSTEQGLATSQLQASLMAMRNEAQHQQQVADVLSQQAQQAQSQVQPSSNPPGVGGNVDTYA